MKQELPIGEAAQYLGLSVDKVRRLENEGILEANRTLGGHRRFHIVVLDSYRKRTKPEARFGRRASPMRKRASLRPVGSALELVDDPDEWTEFDSKSPGITNRRVPATGLRSSARSVARFGSGECRPRA